MPARQRKQQQRAQRTAELASNNRWIPCCCSASSQGLDPSSPGASEASSSRPPPSIGQRVRLPSDDAQASATSEQEAKRRTLAGTPSAPEGGSAEGQGSGAEGEPGPGEEPTKARVVARSVPHGMAPLAGRMMALSQLEQNREPELRTLSMASVRIKRKRRARGRCGERRPIAGGTDGLDRRLRSELTRSVIPRSRSSVTAVTVSRTLPSFISGQHASLPN